ncbi:D-alanyl-D-alanine carboxypeptidase [Kitasatospora sp. SolWspMP-SS2h]|uniref:D-alanyl-D-alanine carboxypeptidase n=1 Tax=Kitasatospora sp. SolWspMP-SS2h TaxID=1305729 RepID=UPI000DBAB168|nr:D-alanyl-D-alanine carboxypeptidase [Kitasatospora sp. SolWspMP-SS2h]RAJ39642.1 D-alanyl-D-alanine carboxypeptidase [Kitasatospora sp. SolWspMP-SS2h]
MGESPQSERHDGETRSAETEETPREPGERAGGNGTVHLRVRDADTRTAALRLPADLPEASAALADSRPTPRDEDAPESETESAPTPAVPDRPETRDAGGGEGDDAEDAEDPEESEAEAVPAGPQRTMMLRMPELPETGSEDGAAPAAEAGSEGEDEGEGEAAPAGGASAEDEAAPADEGGSGSAAKPEPTMMLRLTDLPEAADEGEDEAGAEHEDEGVGAEGGSEGESVPAGPQPTVTLRAAGPAKAGAAAGRGKAEDAEQEDEDAEQAETGSDAGPAAKPDPTMTLRVDKDRPEQTVMLRLPPEAAAPGPEPKAGPKSAPAAAASVPAPVRASAPAAAAVPPPAPPVPAAPGPESTIEALEVLKSLSARPMTPLRRAVKRITVWGVFLAVVLGVLVAAQLLRPLPTPKAKLSLADSFTFGGEQPTIPWPTKGQAAAEVVGVGSLGASGEETPVPIASVTKVMNAYLILQAHPLKKGESGPVLTVDKLAAQESGNNDESTVPLTEGQQLTQYEALEMLMLPSANNVARLLARWDSGSEPEFVKKMNDTAAQLGMGNTTYADAAGYSNDTKSTAKDQLKLAEKAMQLDIFKQVIAEPDTRFNGQRIYNTNKLLGKNGMIGGKTGSSTPAQSCLMWAAVKEVGGVQRMVLGVTLGQPATKEDPSLVTAAQAPSQRINVAAQTALAGQTLAKQGDVVGHVDDGVGGKVPVVAAKDLTVAGWNGITAHLTLTPVGKIAHTLPAGTQVGTIAAGEGDGRVEVPVVLRSDLAPASITSRLLRLG